MHFLDADEVGWWRDRVQSGNLYINRAITVAIVQRQPFGGWKKSCVGPGAKVGGPNYVLSFCRLSDLEPSHDNDYREAWKHHFSIERDPSGMKCESNVFRYCPCRGVVLRLKERKEQVIQSATLAAMIAGVPLTLCLREEESDLKFMDRLPALAKSAEFIRTITPSSDEVLKTVHDFGLNWIDAPLNGDGRIELTRWLCEQSVSETRHRYGQLPEATTGEMKPCGRQSVIIPKSKRRRLLPWPFIQCSMPRSPKSFSSH